MSDPALPPRFPDWEQLYRAQSVETMPWYTPTLDPDLAEALSKLQLTRGRVLDVGTGPGTQALGLAALGFEVLGTDISEAAIEKATERARERTLVKFQQDDVLASALPDGAFDLVFDRGCFHTLKPEQRADYARAIRAKLTPGGLLILKVFSDQQPGTFGPHRFSPQTIGELFGADFEIVSIARTVYQGTLEPLPKALFCVLRARG